MNKEIKDEFKPSMADISLMFDYLAEWQAKGDETCRDLRAEAEKHFWGLLDVYAIFEEGIEKFKERKTEKEKAEVEKVILTEPK